MCVCVCLCVFVCVCVCVCDAQIIQIMLKLRGSTMMRRNHEFFCSVALSPGFRNWVEMTHNMQQEGVGLVLLPRPASLVRSPMLPCVEAPLGESVVPLADAGGEKPTGAAVLLADAGGEKPTGAAGAHAGRGWKGVGWRLVLCDLPVFVESMTIQNTGLMRAGGPQPWLLAACRSGYAAGCCPEDAGSNPPPKGNTRRRRGSRRPAVPVTGGTAAGVMCSVPCFSVRSVARSAVWTGH